MEKNKKNNKDNNSSNSLVFGRWPQTKTRYIIQSVVIVSELKNDWTANTTNTILPTDFIFQSKFNNNQTTVQCWQSWSDVVDAGQCPVSGSPDSL